MFRTASDVANQNYETTNTTVIKLGKLVIVMFAVKIVSTAFDWVNILELQDSSAAHVVSGYYDTSGDAEFSILQNSKYIMAAGGSASLGWHSAVFAYMTN